MHLQGGIDLGRASHWLIRMAQNCLADYRVHQLHNYLNMALKTGIARKVISFKLIEPRNYII